MKLAAFALVLLLAACAQPRAPQLPEATLPATFGANAAASPVLAERWWQAFNEPALDKLVEQALAGNLDLRQAAARVDETATALALARAAQWPTLQGSAFVGHARSNGVQASQHTLALATSFELDLWGRLQSATGAAQYLLLAAEQARDTVRLALVASVVQAQLAVRALDVQGALLAEQQALREASLALVQRRVRGGVASGLDLAQAEGAAAATAVQRSELQRQRALLVNQLALLTGQPGLVLAVDTRPLPAPATVPPGLPSELLERRPDVAQAESAMRAAFAQFDVVKKSAWPTLLLNASVGAQSNNLLELLNASARTWSLGPQALVTLFDAGRAQARSDAARAQAEQAALGWQRAAQAAFKDVADALAAAEQLATQDSQVQRQQMAAREALRIAQRRYDNGYSAYLEVLDAQRSEQDVALALLRLQQQRLEAQLALLKALGGGWRGGGR